ncbi:MAG: hypothetical protein HY070_09320 [Chloroflexi bacterium]|nr:hypothetical protein [Chloroflexota bacterium]MBI3741940.1 hypothetical protein [Chloroflexota bacterium]
MEQTQTAQMVKWLDEEHRREKNKVAEVMDQIALINSSVASLGKTVQDLAERVGKLQSQALRYGQIEQAVGQINAQVQIALDNYDKRRQQLEEDAFKIRQQEREREDHAVRQLQMQMDALQQFHRTATGDHEVIQRLDLLAVTLQREIEDLLQHSEDDNRRIGYVEEWVNRGAQLTTELHQLSERLRAERAESAEAARRAEQQRARHMAEWSEQVKALRDQINIDELRAQEKEGRKRLVSMQELEERIKQLEPRLTQWQKMAEESRRKERDQLLADLEKRWQQQLGEWTFLRDEWNKRQTAFTERVTKLEDWRPDAVSQLHELMDKFEKERRERALISDVLKMQSEMERQGLKAVEELLARLESDAAGAKKKMGT